MANESIGYTKTKQISNIFVLIWSGEITNETNWCNSHTKIDLELHAVNYSYFPTFPIA